MYWQEVTRIFMLIFIPFSNAVLISKYIRVKQHARLDTFNSEHNVKSTLDCSQSCSPRTTCYGFNHRNDTGPSHRKCNELTLDDISSGVLVHQDDCYVYVKRMHVQVFKQSQVSILFLFIVGV